MSSVRTDTGSNIDDTLALGRCLASHFDDHDTVRHWMAHHLSELIIAAEDDSTATFDQRQQVIDMILKIWSYRRHFPEGSPLEGYPAVFGALEYLGDGTPWKLKRLLGDDALDESTQTLPLVAAAIELDHLAQDTVVSLICLAAEDAQDNNSAWLRLADKVANNVESRVTRELQRLRRRVRGRPNTDQSASAAANASGAMSSGSAEKDGEIASLDSSALANHHAAKLRAMADLLTRVADQLAFADNGSPDSDDL